MCCSGHLAPLHTVQTLWKVSRLARVLRCSASVKTNNSACACEIMTAVKNLSQSVSLLLPKVLFFTDIDDCLACTIAKNTLPRWSPGVIWFIRLSTRFQHGEGGRGKEIKKRMSRFLRSLFPIYNFFFWVYFSEKLTWFKKNRGGIVGC